MGSAPKSVGIFKLIEGVEAINGKGKCLVPEFLGRHVHILGAEVRGNMPPGHPIMLSDLIGTG